MFFSLQLRGTLSYNRRVPDHLRKGTSMNQPEHMLNLREAIQAFTSRGYTEDFNFEFDHFSTGSREIHLYPKDFVFDEIVRIENASDPDNQDILYAISSPSKKLKGLYVESYGLNSHEMAPTIIAKIRELHERQRVTITPPVLD